MQDNTSPRYAAPISKTLGPELSFTADHELKTWPGPFSDVVAGLKTAEYRKNDRGFKTGDWLLLREWQPDSKQYSGREVFAKVTHITTGFGIPDGFAMLSLDVLRHPSPLPQTEPRDQWN